MPHTKLSEHKKQQRLYVRTKEDWSYWEDDIGPSEWPKIFPAGAGKRQSPIDLVAKETTFDETLGDGKFSFQYHFDDFVDLINTGFSCQVQCKDDVKSTLSAVHLPAPFRLRQTHFHWGTDATDGSEHVVEGKGYAGEMHIVHWNSTYPSFQEALKHEDGLAVVGVFLKESNEDNKAFNALVKMVDQIPYKGDKMTTYDGFDVNKLLPKDKSSYWTYEGSLTTPPLLECVLWTIFREPIPISTKQLDKLRQICAETRKDAEDEAIMMVENVRPPQPLNGRKIRANFK